MNTALYRRGVVALLGIVAFVTAIGVAAVLGALAGALDASQLVTVAGALVGIGTVALAGAAGAVAGVTGVDENPSESEVGQR